MPSLKISKTIGRMMAISKRTMRMTTAKRVMMKDLNPFKMMITRKKRHIQILIPLPLPSEISKP
jgi:WD40 repeat protein